jgi:hypothetical protein
MQGATVSASREEKTALIGRNLKLARKLAGGMTQLAVVEAQAEVVEPADRLFKPTELSGWENGHRRPSDHYIERIGLITGQTFDWFFASHDDLEG